MHLTATYFEIMSTRYQYSILSTQFTGDDGHFHKHSLQSSFSYEFFPGRCYFKGGINNDNNKQNAEPRGSEKLIQTHKVQHQTRTKK